MVTPDERRVERVSSIQRRAFELATCDQDSFTGCTLDELTDLDSQLLDGLRAVWRYEQRHPWDRCHRDHEPDEATLADTRYALGLDATDDEVWNVAVIVKNVRCREEPCGAGEDPYGRTAEDWAHHAE